MVGSRSEPRFGRPRAALDLCGAFLTQLPISGASVTVISSSGAQIALCSSDGVAARIDELQFELGEGPQWEATHSGRIVMIPDVTDIPAAVRGRWPIFVEALSQMAVGAIFSIPMRMGAVTVGAATLYRTTPGGLDENRQLSALAIASAIASSAVQRAMNIASNHTDDVVNNPADSDAGTVATSPLHREVHQATGMILAQLDTTATIAYSRLQGHAFAEGRTVQSVARDVVSGALTFTDLPR
jgi:GAF domain-containing protein